MWWKRRAICFFWWLNSVSETRKLLHEPLKNPNPRYSRSQRWLWARRSPVHAGKHPRIAQIRIIKPLSMLLPQANSCSACGVALALTRGTRCSLCYCVVCYRAGVSPEGCAYSLLLSLMSTTSLPQAELRLIPFFLAESREAFAKQSSLS